MNFWVFAVALLAIPAAVISWPLFAGTAKERMLGLWIVLMMPLAGLLLYQQVGTPEAINQAPASPGPAAATNQATHPEEQPQMDVLIERLQQRMAENPDNPEGWIMLGRSLKTMQRYTEAQSALANANRLTPGNAQIMVELAEANLFVTGSNEITTEMRQLLESALEIDPQQQKGLWLLGMAALHEGDNAAAIDLWQQLLKLVEPASGAAQAVTAQIKIAQTGMGQPIAAGVEIPLRITLADELKGDLPQSAVLFVFLHPAGAGGGMPLAVRRIAAPDFPLSMKLSNADVLRPGTELKNFAQLDISARISLTGVANAAPGDFQANVITIDTQAPKEIALHLGQRVP